MSIRSVRVRTLPSALLVALVAMTACGDEPTEPTTTAGTIAVAITGTTPVAMAVGESRTLTVSVTRAGGYTGAVDLSIEGEPTGMTTALSTARLETGVSSATLTVSTGATFVPATASLTVRAKASGLADATTPLAVTVIAATSPSYSLTLPSAVSLTQGATASLAVAIQRANGFAGAVALSVDGLPAGVTAGSAAITSGASSTTITLTATASAAVGAATLTVRASATGLTDRTGSVPLTVSTSASAVSVTLSQTAATVVVGATQQLQATVTGTSNTAVTWSTSAAATATVNNGVVTGVAAGTATIKATSVADPTKSASATVTVTTTAEPGFELTVTPMTGLTVQQGGSTAIVVKIARTGGFTGSVSIGSRNAPSGVASLFGTVSSSATMDTVNLSASTSAPVGTHTITVRAVDFGVTIVREVTIPLTITAAKAVGVDFSVSNLSVPLGSAGTVTLTVGRLNGYTGDVSINVSGAPVNVTTTLDKSFLTNGATTATLSVNVFTKAAVGSSTLTVSVSGSGVATVTKTIPLSIPGLQPGKWKVASLSSNGGTTCALTTAGAAYCWGINYDGLVGNGTFGSGHHAFVAVPVSGGHVFKQITLGDASCGLTTAGAAYCWGWNRYGQVGVTPSETPVTTPVAVSGGLTFASLTAGAGTTCGLTTQGAAYCWGSGAIGELGNGTWTEKSSTPVPVSGGLVFTSLTAGRANVCGLVASGEAYCWGYGQFGVLTRPGNSLNSNVPIPVATAHRFKSLVAMSGSYVVCGITTGGPTYCWGENSDGQLGNGAKATYVATPVLVGGGHSFASIGRGSSRATCGLKSDGAALCWGYNFFGNFGNQTQTSSTTPVAAGFGLSFRTITGGPTTCGITLDDYAYCMGDGVIDSENGAGGQLGNGKTPFSGVAHAPVPVFAPGTPITGGGSPSGR